MAQKKVILKDGSNDLLPKTLASMVFTEAGQTVEEALQSAGGGGSSSGGGTGNVNVTNASSLQKDAYYAFQPSAAGSLTGKFATLPYASSEAAGLMSVSDYNKLKNIRNTVDLPSGLKDLTAESTDEQVFDVLKEMLNSMGTNIEGNYPDGKMAVGHYSCLIFAMILSGDDSHNFQFALDKNPVSASFEVQGPDETSGQQYPIKGTASFTYVSSGKLRTVTLTATLNSSGESATYDFTAEVVESGDDTYYLPIAVAYLQPGAKKAEIDEAFGGEGKFKEALKAGTDKKKVYIYSSVIGIIPVSVYSIMGSTGYISFMYRDIEGTTKIQHIIASTVNIIYPEGYKLSPSLYSLTSSSSSDDISTAVGGESGLKEIIQAVKDGNRLVIRGTPPDDLDIGQFSTDVLMSQYKESENGDIQIIYTLFGWAQGGGYLGGSMYALVYTKSSNTFDLSKVNFQLSS